MSLIPEALVIRAGGILVISVVLASVLTLATSWVVQSPG
jgi:hypothetical protein